MSLAYIASSPLFPAKILVLSKLHFPGGAVERRRGEVVLDLLLDLLGGRGYLRPPGAPQEALQIQSLIAPPPSFHEEDHRVRSEPASFERAQGVPEPETGDAQLTVRSGLKALDRQGFAWKTDGEAGREGVVDQAGDLVRRILLPFRDQHHLPHLLHSRSHRGQEALFLAGRLAEVLPLLLREQLLQDGNAAAPRAG